MANFYCSFYKFSHLVKMVSSIVVYTKSLYKALEGKNLDFDWQLHGFW